MPAMARSAVPRPASTAHNATPNDALMRDAPGFAPAIAALWPRPHTPYVEADRPRRLLVCWLVRNCVLTNADAEACATWSLRRLVTTYLPDAPEGLVEALRRAEDGPWPVDPLAQLVALLQEGGDGPKTLRHAPVITKDLVQVLSGLPQALRRPRIAALLTPRDARLVGRAVRHCWGRSPDERGLRRLADRLERAPRAQTLFGWLVEELGLSRLAPPPIPATDWLQPILDIRGIERTALRFQNCLRGRIPLMLRGQAAYFEVLGPEPAVVELLVGRGVWLVGEIRGHANVDVSAGLLQQIHGHLHKCGALLDRSKAPSTLALELAHAAGW